MHTTTLGRHARRGFSRRWGSPSAFSTLAGIGALLLAATLGACAPAEEAPEATVAEAPVVVRPGIEVLLSDSVHLVRGKKVGLITNHSGMDRTGKPTIDLLNEHPEVEVVGLYAPEHGIRGAEFAGAPIASSVDEKTGIPIHSVFGESEKFSQEMLEGVDALVFDIQDVGVRYYTYPSTMAYGMMAAGEKGIPFIVLDRPNPVRGDVIQGNILDTAFASFVGLYPVPMRHGLTLGELARLIVGEFGVQVELHVVPVDGLRRDMTFDQTNIPWVKPSPSMPTLEAALAYAGTRLFEATPISVGRGSDHASQWVGAPWLDGVELAAALNARAIPGVTFEPATFTPVNAGDKKFEGVEVHGVRHVPQATDYDAPRAGIATLVEIYKRSQDQWEWREGAINRLSGTDQIRLAIDAGKDVDEIMAGWDEALVAFKQRSAPYLIYR
ncbi:MAG: DUF1343 domain-containing protein [Longimicrobiales bacterium]|nr:DUF1343 domain-containing protein [Longimicrobiales bacterium]